MPRLESEIRAQVFPDGAQYELSPGYHAMCAHLFNLARRQAEFRGSQFSDEYKRRLDRMFDYLTAITRPDGSCAVPNDAGCALQRGNNRLLEAAELYKRDDWRWAGSHGQAGVRPDHVGTVDFTDAGHVVMRSGWDPDDRWAFFDVAELGAAHQHEDKLHVDLYAFKTPFLIDPGISSYQHDPVVVFFRESRAHNTIDVDGLGQWRRRSGDYARFSSSSRGKNLFSAGKLLDFAQGSYDDIYGNAAAGALENIVHTRALVFVRPDYWLIIDSIRDSADNTTPRTIEAFWHFTPMHVRADTATGIVRTNRLSHANLEMVFRGHWDGAELELVTAREEPVQGFVAIDMEVKPATCAIARTTRPLPMHGVTVALPYATGSESQCRVTSADVASRSGTGAGLAVTVARADGSQDLFVWRHTGKGALELKSGGTSGRPAIASDALLSMVRLDKAGQPIAAALTHGRRLSVGNRKIDGLPQGLAEWQA